MGNQNMPLVAPAYSREVEITNAPYSSTLINNIIRGIEQLRV